MSNDFLEQLATLEVRQPPPEFDRTLHQHVNRALLTQHLLGLAVGCIPWVLTHFLRGMVGAVVFSMTGRFGDPEPQKDEDSGEKFL